MRFCVLGQFEIDNGAVPVDLGTGMLRRLLVVLLSRAGQPVAVPDLVEALWPDEAPANASKTIQLYVHRLRKRLADPDRIVWQPTGYAVQVGPGELDATEFVETLARARAAREAGELQDAAELFGRASRLWRGPPYAEVADCPLVLPESQRLSERRMRALEERIAVELELERHADLVPELSALVVEHPYREGLWAQLMLALYRSGRQVDALEAYARLHRALADELGVEPGAEPRRLHEAILRNEPL